MARLLDWLFRLPPFRGSYLRARVPDGRPFSARALAALGVEVATALSDVAKIPAHGPIVVVANHPHGLVDGLALLDVVHRVRPDVRVLTNYLAAGIPELHAECFFVDPFGGRAAARRSRAGLRKATRWLTQGGALVVFPAGEVAPALDAAGRPVDGAWLPGAAKLAAAAGAALVPLRIDGRNPRLFYAAGPIHPALRTLLLPWALLRARGTTIGIRVATPLRPEDFADARACTAAARAAADRLGASGEAIIAPIPPGAIDAEIRALPPRALLLESGDWQVWCVKAPQIPHTLRELGRLREVTFRAAGEGTGRAIDLDEFDRWYEHLFVWNSARQVLAGAYRIGRSDEIVRARGVAGLYTHTLFRYDSRLLDRIGPALELGRSFVRAEYQRSSNALLLLWRGIGALIAREPRYRILFGPVSISNRYRDASQRMLMAFLYENHYNRELGELVRALNPVPERAAPRRSTSRPSTGSSPKRNRTARGCRCCCGSTSG